MEIKRFGVYFAGLDPTIGREINKTRPVVVVSKNDMNKYAATIVICPLTSTIHKNWRSRIQINCQGKKAEIAVDQIRTIDKQRLLSKFDILSRKDSARLTALIEEMYC